MSSRVARIPLVIPAGQNEVMLALPEIVIVWAVITRQRETTPKVPLKVMSLAGR